MPNPDNFQHVSAASTLPKTPTPVTTFDVADLYRGPVANLEPQSVSAVPLDEKLRQVYFWIINHGVISPHYDIEYNDEASQSFSFGDAKP